MKTFNFTDLLPESREFATPENVALLKQAVDNFNAQIGYNKTGATNLQEVAKMAIESKLRREKENE